MRATRMGQCTYTTACVMAVELVVVHTPLMIKERRTRHDVGELIIVITVAVGNLP